MLVAAVAVGVAALVAINSFTDNLLDSVRAQARALLGADLALSSGAPLSTKAEEDLARLVREATVGGEAPPVARVTRFAAMAYAPRRSGARLVQVMAVEPGYPFYGTIETAPAGLWGRLDAEGDLIADASLLTALGAEVGDTVVLGEAQFRILGTVVNVPGDVGVRAAFGPRVFIAAKRLDETGLLTFGSRARYEAYLKLADSVDAQGLAERFRSPLSAERVTVRTVSDDQARLNETLSRLGRYLALVALIALLLGGLGVASAVHVFIKRKIETVAVLRCLGASSRRVLAVYLTQAAAIGLVGSVLGAVLGVAIQLVLPRVLGDFVPVDVRVTPSWSAIASGVGVGLWVTLVFSLLPLLAVRRISPLVVLRRPFEDATPSRRDPARLVAAVALAASVTAMAIVQADRLGTGLAFAAGIGTALAALWLASFVLVRGVRRSFPRRLPYLWRQGLANLYRPANQTVTVVVALGFGAFLLGTLLLLQTNLLADLRFTGDRARPNLAFFDIQPDQVEAIEKVIATAGFGASPAVPIVPMRLKTVKGESAAERLAAPGDARAVRDRWALRREYRSSYRDHPTDSERLVAGRWWTPEEARGSHVPVSLEEGLARELRVGVGDEIVWDVQGVSVVSRVANLREVHWARFEPNFFAVFAGGLLDGAPRTFVTLIRVEDAVQRGRLQRRVAEAMPNVTSLDLAQVQQAVDGILARAALAIRFMALFSLAAGAVVLVGAVATSRYQRVREGVLLRTLGATRAQVRRVLFAEYASLGAMAASTALALSILGGWALVRFVFDSRFTLSLPALLGLSAGVVVLTLLVGFWGSADVYRRTPIEVLRAE
jgi:putative ABC transport system permease protein